MNPHHLHLQHARKHYTSAGDTFELRIPQMQLKRGGVYVVAGKSGCGKTTLLDALGCISHFNQVDEFTLEDADGRIISLAGASNQYLAKIRRNYIGYILQQGGLLPYLTAKDNIMLPIRLSRPSSHLERAALEMAEHLGIEPHLLNHYPQSLSIGQRQRVSIARALAHQPELLLADEPTGALDPSNALVVKELLLKYARIYGITTVIVTHDVELFAHDADAFFGFSIRRQGSSAFSTLVEERRRQ